MKIITQEGEFVEGQQVQRLVDIDAWGSEKSTLSLADIGSPSFCMEWTRQLSTGSGWSER